MAQNATTITLEWNDTAKVVENDLVKVPYFDNMGFYYDAPYRQIKYSNSFEVPFVANENSVTLISVRTAPIEKADLHDINISQIPNTIDFLLESGQAREQFFASVTFNPIIKEGNSFKKVLSITYSYQLATNNNLENRSIASIQNSVLSSGEWFRFPLSKSGVYKLSKTYLSNLGFNTNVDPRNIKIYGNGGRMVPLLNSTSYPIDLEENAIKFIGESDGVFNDGDYILFYAEGTDVWNEESLTSKNLFSDVTYYYITHSSTPSKRIQNAIEPAGTSTLNFNTFNAVTYYENELVNVAKVGRRWFGEAFKIQNTQDFNFNIPNLVTTEPVKLKINFASKSLGNSSFTVKANGQSMGAVSFISTVPFGGNAAYENFFAGNVNLTNSNLAINLTYNNGGVPTSEGYLDFIRIESVRNLVGYGKQFEFYNPNQETNIGVGSYTLSNAAAISEVWNVSDIYNVSSYNNSNGNAFNFKVNLGFNQKYVAVDGNDFYLPASATNARVANQNLKGTIFKNASGAIEAIDYLIITPQFLINQAEALAQFHRNYSGMSVRVVSLDKIYQEFSSGKQDLAAIRNFIRYVYENATSPSEAVKYVNLFGDASYDYKDRMENNTNIVPTFHGFNPQANQSNNPSNMSIYSTFVSDDFFGLMHLNEGPMTGSFDNIDIAVGRMLVSSTQQAQEMVNKVIEYHDEASYGRWRNKYVVYSDDADNTVDATLQVSLNALADNLTLNRPFVNVKKIHTDAYLQQVASGGERYPQAKEEFLNEIQSGALVFNYFGHGNEEFLGRERLFEKLDAQNLYNKNRYPLFITITCEFTRFDDPTRKSGGEFLYWNPNGGAISTIATNRQIAVNTGLTMNDYINERLYNFGGNGYPSIAEALRQVKLLPNTSSNRRVVAYIGDPALFLAIPKPKVVLTKVNDIDIASFTGTFEALALMKIEGEVRDENDVFQPSYNGDVAVQIFDKDNTRTTLGNDGVRDGSNQLITMTFVTLGETIFRGNASVVNGKFEFSFVVPKDIKIQQGNGKISFYSKSSTPTLQDNTGFNTSIIVGGVNTNAVADNTAPTVKVYLNDESFVSGGVTNCSPILLAFLEDENGINTASGIGHDIVAILDGDEENPYVLNDYYETENNDYTKGFVKFPFRDLEAGLHTILFKAWDVYNNPITKEIQFNAVCSSEGIKLENVLNYPNPFVSYTEFWFSHNRPFENLDVQVQVFTITGKVVKTINQQVFNTGFLSREIKWDGRDDFGSKIGKGVYVYKLTVRSSVTGETAKKIEKIVLL